MKPYNSKLKMVIMGDTNVGKTSIITRISKDTFGDALLTIGASFLTYDYNYIRYEIWDTAGSEKFLALSPMYSRGSHISLLVYDLSNLESINRLQKYFKIIEHNTCNQSKIIVIGNKLDLINVKDLLQTQKNIVDKIKNMTSLKIETFLYVSAKNCDNIDVLNNTFTKIGESLALNSMLSIDKNIIYLDDMVDSTAIDNAYFDCGC